MWELEYKESWAPKIWYFWTVVLEKTLESPLDSKEIQPVHPKGNQSWIVSHWKDWCWSWSSNTLATWCEELTHWKRPWCWERLKAGGEGEDRGWDDWMASPTRSTGVWVSSGRWWWTGKPGVLQSMGLQRVGHDWVNWTKKRVAIWISFRFSILLLLNKVLKRNVCVCVREREIFKGVRTKHHGTERKPMKLRLWLFHLFVWYWIENRRT